MVWKYRKMKLNIKTLLFIIGVIVFTTPLKAYYPVFDATNNLLATLQKTMDGAFQTLQKTQMYTLIDQGIQDYQQQIKIFDECVKQYEEAVKIYNQAVQTYNWIDRNIGNASSLTSFLGGDYANVSNIKQLFTLVNTILSKDAVSIDANYSTTLLKDVDQIINQSFLEDEANKIISTQRHSIATMEVAAKENTQTSDMLNKLRAKDKILENQIATNNANLMQVVHAQEQTSVFIAEELARTNVNLSTLSKAAASFFQNMSHQQLVSMEQNALQVKVTSSALDKVSNNLKKDQTRRKLRELFSNRRLF
jgi:hypothetical protein